MNTLTILITSWFSILIIYEFKSEQSYISIDLNHIFLLLNLNIYLIEFDCDVNDDKCGKGHIQITYEYYVIHRSLPLFITDQLFPFR